MGKNKDKKQNHPNSDSSKREKLGILDEQTLGYYRRISETLKGSFDSDVEQELFINNVFTQLTKEILTVSRNQTASRIIEELTLRGGRDQIISLLEALSADWETACCDRFSSYVTQSLILHCNQYLDDSKDSSDGAGSTLSRLIDDLYSFLMSQIALYMQHTYASHVLRVLLEVLSGLQVSAQIIKSRLSRGAKSSDTKNEVKLRQPPAVYIKKLSVMCETIVKLNKLSDHIQNGLSSPVLQTVLLVSRSLGPDGQTAICQTLLQTTDMFKTNEGEELPVNVTHEIASHFMEQLIATVPSDWLDKILSQFFVGRLVQMAKHPLANFVLQKLLASLKTSEQYESVFAELAPHVESILAVNHIGVIVKMAETCVRLRCKQKKFIKALLKAFHCYKPAERQCKLFSLVASLTSYEVFYNIREKSEDQQDSSDETPAKEESSSDESSEDDDEDIKIPTLTTINFHGSLLLQKLLQFSNPKPVVTGLMELKSSELRTLCMDSCGSHVVEAFLDSDTVGDKSRESFTGKLKGQLVDLACDKFGSRVFDCLWKHSSLKHRGAIAEELKQQEQRVRGNKFGFYIHSRCALDNFRKRPQEWNEFQTSQIKKRKQFEDALQDDQSAAKTKKAKGLNC